MAIIVLFTWLLVNLKSLHMQFPWEYLHLYSFTLHFIASYQTWMKMGNPTVTMHPSHFTGACTLSFLSWLWCNTFDHYHFTHLDMNGCHSAMYQVLPSSPGPGATVQEQSSHPPRGFPSPSSTSPLRSLVDIIHTSKPNSTSDLHRRLTLSVEIHCHVQRGHLLTQISSALKRFHATHLQNHYSVQDHTELSLPGSTTTALNFTKSHQALCVSKCSHIPSTGSDWLFPKSNVSHLLVPTFLIHSWTADTVLWCEVAVIQGGHLSPVLKWTCIKR